MDLESYVKQNQKVIDFVNDVTPGHIDKYTGTLDYATARFNTILLKLSQDALKADQYREEVKECFEIIQDFYSYTVKYTNTSRFFAVMIKLILHYKGKVHIPKIKLLLEKINN
jgi:hypothetical protein